MSEDFYDRRKEPAPGPRLYEGRSSEAPEKEPPPKEPVPKERVPGQDAGPGGGDPPKKETADAGSRGGRRGGGKKKKDHRDPKKLIIAAIVLILLALLIPNCFYILTETESAVVTTFGKASLNMTKGLSLKIPLLQKVRKVNTTVQNFTIGYLESGGYIQNIEDESTMITSDMNFVDIDFYVTYQVDDPIRYLYASSAPELILKNMIQSAIRGTVSAYSVDSALTTGKSEIQQNIKNIVMEELARQEIGLALVDLSIQDVEPPTEEIKEAFSDVENARQNKESALNEANQYRNEQIPAAEARSDKIIQEAEAKKTARINEANGQLARFAKEYEQYRLFPEITRYRMFYETMEEILPDAKIVISNDGSAGVGRTYIGDLDGSLAAAGAALTEGGGRYE